MSNIIDKKQIIHIIAEIIIIFGISIYFSQKNKQLLNLINDLNQRLEDQEEQLNKHEQAINNLSNQISQLLNKPSNNLPVNINENFVQKNIPVKTVEREFVSPQNLKQNIQVNVPNNNAKNPNKNKVQFTEPKVQ